MTLVKAGCGHCHPSDFFIERPQGSGNWLLLIIKSSGQFVIAGERHIVRPNSMVLYRKGTPQFYGALGGQYCDDWMHMHLDGDDEDRINELGIPIDAPFALGDTVRISACITEIYREYRTDGTLARSNTSLNFHLLLNRVREALDARQKGYTIHYRKLLEIRADIYMFPAQDWSVDVVSGAVCLSRSSTQHLYREVFGVSITEDVIAARVSAAKHLLQVSMAPVYSVAKDCGYASDIHFIRQFKAHTGSTPHQYRLAQQS